MRIRPRPVVAGNLVAAGLLGATAHAQDAVIITGTDGDDGLNGTDAAESLYAGAGDDTARIDRIDVVSSDCERRPRSPVTISPGLTLLTRKRQTVISSITSRSSASPRAVACTTS
jgi:hypothetical protein